MEEIAMFGLDEGNFNKLLSVFSRHPEIVEVIVYGSRAKGNYRKGSDIDLTIKGSNLTEEQLSKLQREIDDLLLPYTVDLSIYDGIESEALIAHIKRVGQVFYRNK